MRPALKWIALAGAVALAGAGAHGRVGLADAQEGEAPSRSARGGLLAETSRHRFEVFFYPTGVRVFPQGRAGTPLDASTLGATATFYHPNVPDTPWFTRQLGAADGSLDLAIGLANVPRSGAKVGFQITGLADPAEPSASFAVPLEFVPQAPAQPVAAAPPAAAEMPSPRYVYAPGYYGYGYYAYPGPETLPRQAAPAPTYFGAPPPLQRPPRDAALGRRPFRRPEPPRLVHRAEYPAGEALAEPEGLTPESSPGETTRAARAGPRGEDFHTRRSR